MGDEYRQNTQLITYLTLMRESDKAFKHLIDYFSGVDKPVIICMFGDHQPNLDIDYGDNSGDIGIIEKRYSTPYLIWANYSNGELPSNMHKDISVNYLGAYVLTYAGINTPYTEYLLELEKNVPIINFAGYMDNNKTWHSIEEYNKYVAEYRKMGYYMMFE